MTTLAATSAMINLARPAAPRANPRYNPAFLAEGGILGWLGQSSVVRALIARKATADQRRALSRLALTSPHLADDVARPAAPAMGDSLTGAARPMVAARPAQRPAIARRPAMPTARPVFAEAAGLR